MVKFTHGVEIGAYQAYIGHYARTNDPKVSDISGDEYGHQLILRAFLKEHGEKRSYLFDIPFFIIGFTVRLLCQISPVFMLNKVATLLEYFAVFSYEKLSHKYPAYKQMFLSMAETENEHKVYFKELK